VPIVGLGCSAGGLEALQAFLQHVPANSGLAYVIIQHLAPHHASTLPALLQQACAMTVHEITNDMEIAPDTVYVTPPGQDLALAGSALQLKPSGGTRGQHLPIDSFMHTLARERGAQAIGLVLSGMGADGTLGLGAIQAAGGLTLAQAPAEARASSMPESAIRAGVARLVAPARELPTCIQVALHQGHGEPADAAGNQDAIREIIALLRTHSGNDLSQYKPSTLQRRIERRTGLLRIANARAYAHYLQDNPQELELLFKELLIGVTRFFRDAEVWKLLRDTVIPALFANHPDGRALRAWVPACSTGEEAYSLAMVFSEALAHIQPAAQFSLQIYATDLDGDAIDRARKAVYPAGIGAEVGPKRLAQHFTATPEGYRLNQQIREMVIFAPQNLVSDPPFTRLDIISCRNLLIYFGQALQRKILPLFHYALNPDGILVLGSAETIGSFDNLFVALDRKAHVFQRIEQNQRSSWLSFPAGSPVGHHSAAGLRHTDYRNSVEYLTDQLIQQHYTPAAVLVNHEGDILYISGRTGKYLEPAAGKVNINIHAMAREGLREALTGIIGQALQSPRVIRLNNVQIDSGGHPIRVNVTIQRIDTPEALRNRVLVVFTDTKAPGGNRRTRHSQASERETAQLMELAQLRRALQVNREEMQTSLEEARSINEELQVTNEELTTSKEELQSMNEELQTINAELQSKMDELIWAHNDMTNLLNSTEIATIFLDRDMRLRRFTTHTTHLFKFIPGDVGRPLSDITTVLDYPALLDDARTVLTTQVFSEKQIHAQNQRCYRVRIMPYRTQDNVIDGVVLTFIDITGIKQLEARLHQQETLPEG
jgi:chemotaxis methyl-accepting protein methylase